MCVLGDEWVVCGSCVCVCVVVGVGVGGCGCGWVWVGVCVCWVMGRFCGCV